MVILSLSLLRYSSQEMTSAYEKTTEACSVFNRALRSGLEQKKIIFRELGSHILEGTVTLHVHVCSYTVSTIHVHVALCQILY